MDTLLFMYGSLLTVIFSFAGLQALLLGRASRNKNDYLFGVFFLLYAFDNIVISLTDFIPWFAIAYHDVFVTTAAFKTPLYLATTYVLMYLARVYTTGSLTHRDYSLLSIYVIAMLVTPGISSVPWMTYMFLEPTQLMTFYIGLRSYIFFRKQPANERQNYYNVAKAAAIIIAVMSIIILLEDTYVIFYVDSYSNSGLAVQNRSFSENIMVTSLSILYIWHIAGFAIRHSDESLVDSSLAATSNFIEITAFDSFCHAYRLTDRERDVMKLANEGLTTKEMAEKLMLSPGTVKTHRHNIYVKTNRSNKSELDILYKTYKNAFLESRTLADPGNN